MRFEVLTALFVASAQGRFLSDDYDQLLQTAKDTPQFTLDTSKPLVMNGMYNKGGLGLQHHKKEKRGDEGTGPAEGSGSYLPSPPQGFEVNQLTQKFEELKKEMEKLQATYGGKTKREDSSSSGYLPSPPQGFEVNQLTQKFEELKKEMEKLQASYGGTTKREEPSAQKVNSGKSKREDSPDYSTVITSAMDTDRVLETFDELKREFEKLTGEHRAPVKREEGEENVDFNGLMETFQKEAESFFKEMEEMIQEEGKRFD